MFYVVEEETIQRFGRDENKTVTIDSNYTWNGHNVPILYGQQFREQSLNTYHWYQDRSSFGLGLTVSIKKIYVKLSITKF